MEKMDTNPDQALREVLNELIADMATPDIHYTVSANFYEHQAPDRKGQRWYIAFIWFCQDTAHNLELTDEGLLCDVYLNRLDRSQVSRILLRFDQIWRIERIVGGKGFNPELYYRGDKLDLTRPSNPN